MWALSYLSPKIFLLFKNIFFIFFPKKFFLDTHLLKIFSFFLKIFFFSFSTATSHRWFPSTTSSFSLPGLRSSIKRSLIETCTWRHRPFWQSGSFYSARVDFTIHCAHILLKVPNPTSISNTTPPLPRSRSCTFNI